ncbi:TniQ family protein [Ralstonia mojiangensis]|uniref:TniQ family protein n=1 Tax=Ralstonia mojiangensis TaxID=2953895 RepID=UPI002090D421|nr:TniQ family protein [Ralstonia mojiangensis]MCO5413492.1 TniQ family protein [Ralstonia mojiangensis]
MLRTVAPQQGEYIRGHAGRLGLWNGFLSVEELLTVLDRKTRGDGDVRAPGHTYRLTARFGGLDSATYLKEHSLLPFCRIGARSDDEMFDFERLANLKSQTAWMQPKRGAYLCPTCVAKDERMLGFSYWRAFHQLPGIDTCPKHATALAVVYVDGAFDRLPGSWGTAAEPVDDELVALRAMPVVARYAEIAYAFMAKGQRVSRIAAIQCIRPKVEAMSFPIGTHIERSKLAHRIRDAFPEAWLEAHYPRLLGDCANVQSVNGLCGGSIVSGMVYAMALAATFSTSEEAVHCFYTAPSQRRKMPHASMCDSVETSKRRDDLLPHYIASEGMASYVAAKLGVGEPTALRWLKGVGLPSLGRLARPGRCRVIAFLSRASKDEIDHWIAAGSNVHAIIGG